MTPDTPRTDRASYTTVAGQVVRADLCREMEKALRASITYDEARFRRIRHACFGEVPEGLDGQSKEWVDAVLETDEETTGEEFRKLRTAALGLSENESSDDAACSRLARCGCGNKPKIKYDSLSDRGDHGYDHLTWVECACGMQTPKVHWWTFGKQGQDGSEKAVAIWNQCLSDNETSPSVDATDMKP